MIRSTIDANSWGFPTLKSYILIKKTSNLMKLHSINRQIWNYLLWLSFSVQKRTVIRWGESIKLHVGSFSRNFPINIYNLYNQLKLKSYEHQGHYQKISIWYRASKCNHGCNKVFVPLEQCAANRLLWMANNVENATETTMQKDRRQTWNGKRMNRNKRQSLNPSEVVMAKCHLGKILHDVLWMWTYCRFKNQV